MNDSQNKVLRKSIKSSMILSILMILAFVGVVFLIDALLPVRFSDAALIFFGVVMAFIPSLIWMAYFYRQDRREPEPKGMVLQVFILGGLVAAAIGIPLVENTFDVQSWIDTNLWIHLLGSILVVGVIQETLKYAAVRFSIFPAKEYDEPSDGIIYSTAAGLGFAAVLNLSFIVNSGGVDPGVGAIRVALVALAQASFSGVSGYFLGQAKFKPKPVWYQAAGVILASLLNGLFFFLWGTLSKPRINGNLELINPWVGLILAVILSTIVLFTLSRLISQEQQVL